ncbi:target of Nesh-SH3-like isoform X19 [Acipenser ruthenus]|uniref:target of Nesh-SH3-like isoform X19 n=1 Tax=Acipenser ruthenus TaxID=7906 RepID=UPI002741C8B1|nr:target of Nesh-SH3-like isoform X19 [Acipenser ruthenus]
MLPRLLLLLIAGIILVGYGTAQRLPRVKRQNLKVRINATGDTIVLKFVRPRPDMKLEGFILGYGSSMFSKQYIQLPENGKPYETEVDAEPKYLIAVQPIPDNDVKKQCTGQVNLQKPLHLIIGSVTPSSVLLSWGTFLKTPFEGNIMNDCLEDGHYTVRYREKERNKKWNYENCPISDTVIDRLKPNTKYEFGVRASKGKQDGLWSKPIVHQTNAGSPDKIKGQIDNPGNKIIIDQLRKPQLPDITGLNNRKTIHRTRNPPRLASPLQRSPSDSSRRRQNTVVGKPGNSVKLTDDRQLPDKSSVLRTVLSSVTEKPAKQERKLMTAADIRINATRMEPADNSSVFNPAPLLEIDSMGKERFIAPHVKYMMKEPDDPCSITESLRHFPEEEEALNQDITGPPKHPPSNLTVVTVEGCSSFVILDWQKADNDSATEYEVISKSTGPAGNEESVTVTNQTHTAVENLKADSSYEFTVQPKNVLGVGPPSEVVPFSTESADPRVSEYISGKDAIWTEYPFQSDSYSECNGKQFVKRTWYRKFVGVQLCNSLRYKIYLSDTLAGTFYNIGDQTGHGEDHCQFVDSFLDGRTGQQFPNDQLPQRQGYYRAIRQEPVTFGEIGGKAQINYVQWYECGTTIPGKW